MVNPCHINLVRLEGTPLERGRRHGETLRGSIVELLTQVGELVRQLGGINPQDFFHQMIAATHFVNAVKKWTPDLLAEIQGIGEGAAVAYETILAWQFLEEMEWFLHSKLGPIQPDGNCTVLGAFAQGEYPTILAQNADNPVFLDSHQTLLHIKYPASSLEALVLTFPGLIGVYGLNNRGVGVCINEMVARMNKTTHGLGTTFIARGILSRTSFAEATAFLYEVKHASGNTFTIGSPERVRAYECAPNRVTPYIPEGDKSITYHTNHPLVNDDQVAGDLASDDNTKTRFESLKQRMQAAAWPVTVEAAKAILSGHDAAEYPICRHDMTRYCFIMELSAMPLLHIASGPPCMTEFKTFKF